MTVIVLTTGTTWTVPSDFSTNNTVEVWGGGGGGSTTGALGDGGGGGGAYSAKSNVRVFAAQVINIGIGTGGAASTAGGDTNFNGTAFLLAKGGGGASGDTGGTGGAAASGVGDRKNSGGNGATSATGRAASGGGGSAGQHGNGNNGVAETGDSPGGNGGSGDAGQGGAGGTGGAGNGPPGTANTEGAGGGAGGARNFNGGNGGLPGGGGGGMGQGGTSAGTGGGGQIRITYFPDSSVRDLDRAFHPGKGVANVARFFKTPRSTFIPSAAEADQEAINRRVTENPTLSSKVQFRRNDFTGIQQQPLSADSTPQSDTHRIELELPPRGKTLLHRYQDWQARPLAANHFESLSKVWITLPQLGRRPFHQDWQFPIVVADNAVSFRSTWDENPVLRKWIASKFQDWQQQPLSSDSTPQSDIHRAEFDLPVRVNKRGQDWQRSPLSPDFALDQPPTPTVELPIRGRKPLVLDWQTSPLAGEAPNPTQWIDLPVRARRPLLLDWTQQPLSDPNSPQSDVHRVEVELPVRVNKRGQDWFQSPLSEDFVSPLAPLPSLDLPVKGRKPLLQDWQAGPLGEDSNNPLQFTELPVRGRPQPPRDWLQGPLPEDAPNPAQFFTLPIANYVRRDYNGWQAAPLSADAVPPLIGLWFDNPLRGRYQPQLYAGSMLAPLSDNFVPPPSTQLFLPLVGVGS